MARLALAGDQVLVQRRTHDRMNESQPLTVGEDVGADEIVRGVAARRLAQARDAGHQPQVAVVSEHRDAAGKLRRQRSEAG
jgi:hypothetical protein